MTRKQIQIQIYIYIYIMVSLTLIIPFEETPDSNGLTNRSHSAL